jgi:type II secretory pathway pseudopilin PulG
VNASKRRGFFLADVLFALGIVGVLTVVLASAMRQEMSASKKSSDSRAAGRLAEHAMLDLQHGQPMPMNTDDVHIAVRPASGGQAPAGYSWAVVETRVNGHGATLFGLVPAGSLQGAQP